jgi:hypothetical protein
MALLSDCLATQLLPHPNLKNLRAAKNHKTGQLMANMFPKP